MLTNDNIPELRIERIDDGKGEALILLEQDCGGNTDRVALHPIHLRYLAEKTGLFELADQQSKKSILALKRRLETLFGRIDFMHNFLCNHSDSKHADLTFARTYATATLDIAHEFMVESGINPTIATAEGAAHTSATAERSEQECLERLASAVEARP